MTGVFDRLYARGHGGTTSLPLMRRVPGLYRAAADVGTPSDLGVEMDERPTEAATPVPPAATGNDRMNTPPAPSDPRAAPRGDRKGVDALERVASASVPAAVALPPSNMPLSRAEPPPAAPVGDDRPSATGASLLSERAVEAATPASETASMKGAAVEAPPKRSDGTAAVPAAAPPIRLSAPNASPLERLFTVLDAQPDESEIPSARSPAVPAIPSVGPLDQPQSSALQPAATVTIGRIDIRVAPPPAAAPARSRGFVDYAGVRRGLER